MLDLCELVLADSLKEEVIAIILHNLGNTYDNEEIETYINDFLWETTTTYQKKYVR